MQEINQSDNAEELMHLSNSREERGIRKGIEQGIEERNKEIVLDMLNEGLSTDLIAKVTRLDLETIEKIKKLN